MDISLYPELIQYETHTAGGSLRAGIVSPAAANTKGTYTRLTDANGLSFDSHVLMFSWTNADSNNNHRFLIDVATGERGSEVVVIPNISFVGFAASGASTGFFPLPLKRGTKVSCRVQCASGSRTTASVLKALMFGDVPFLPQVDQYVTYGTTLATTTGTSIDPGGTANQFGAWVEITPSTDLDITQCNVLISTNDTNNGTGAYTEWIVQIAAGASGQETIIHPGVKMVGASVGVNLRPQIHQINVEIKKGVRLSARAACSVNTVTARVISVSLVCGGY